jgi:RNA polymerase sigma-70 factor (ECF subfamily)
LGSLSDRTGLNLPIFWNESGPGSARESVSTDTAVGVPEDEDVMALLRAGDSSALNFLLERYARLVLGIAFRILHDRGEAEEVVQDVFFQVYQKANQFDPNKGKAKAWIVQIAFHKTYDRRLHLTRVGFYRDLKVESICGRLRDRTDLDRELGAKLNHIQIVKALSELTEMQRKTVELYFFEGFTITDVMHRLGESRENVRHHLYRGLERLRQNAFVQRLRDRR